MVKKEIVEQAIRLYQSGLSMTKVCKITAISLCTLQRKLKEAELTRSNAENSKRYNHEALEEAVTLYKNGHTLKEVNAITKVSTHTLRATINKMNIKHKPKTHPLLDQAITLYKSGVPLLKVCKVIKISSACLQRHLHKLKISRSNKINSRKYKVNHHYFSTIDDERKAYWLGFLYADGYITKAKYGKYVGTNLGEKDGYHLAKLAADLQATYPIRHYINRSYGVASPYIRLLISSDQMFDDLLDKGVVERKSLVLTFPSKNIASSPLVHHFIRGYFDGDGSFAKSQNGYQVKICGTKEFLTELAKHIEHPNAKLYRRHKTRSNNNYYISIGGRKQALAIGNYMYKGATIWLERKYKRYQHLSGSNR